MDMLVRFLTLSIIALVIGCSSPETQESVLSKIEEAEKALYGDDENFKFDEE